MILSVIVFNKFLYFSIILLTDFFIYSIILTDKLKFLNRILSKRGKYILKKSDIKFDTSELIILLASKRIKYIDLCYILRQSQATVYKKINGEINFSASDIYRLVEQLEIPLEQINKYFLTIETPDNTSVASESILKNNDLLTNDKSDSVL